MANTQMTSDFSRSEDVYHEAKAGYENALLRLLRDPDYTGETLTINGGSVTITVSGTDPKTITSIATKAGFTKVYSASAAFSSNELSVTTSGEAQ
jgi:hypothetical protein